MTEDYQLLADENRQMALVLDELGLDKEKLDGLCYGGEQAIQVATKLIVSRVTSHIKEELSTMDSDQIFDYTYS